MRKLMLALLGVAASLVFAAAAQAQTVTKETFPVEGSFTSPAGEQCDVAVTTSFTGTTTVITFGDPDNPTRTIEHSTFNIVHTNDATGQFATEFNRGTAVTVGGTTRLTGLFFWHLRDESGKLVLNGAGRLTFSDAGVLTETPGLHTDASLCQFIGANEPS